MIELGFFANANKRKLDVFGMHIYVIAGMYMYYVPPHNSV